MWYQQHRRQRAPEAETGDAQYIVVSSMARHTEGFKVRLSAAGEEYFWGTLAPLVQASMDLYGMGYQGCEEVITIKLNTTKTLSGEMA